MTGNPITPEAPDDHRFAEILEKYVEERRRGTDDQFWHRNVCSIKLQMRVESACEAAEDLERLFSNTASTKRHIAKPSKPSETY